MIIKKYDYKSLERVDTPTGRHYQVDGQPVYSVTTILSATKDMTAIDNWRKNIGKENADMILKESGTIGTHMHNFLEDYVKGNELKIGSNPFKKQAYKLAETIINDGLCDLSEAWGTEVNLHYYTLYSGTTDLVGIYNNKESIVDYKNTRKPKKPEHIEDYKKQLVAYGTAHNSMFGTNIKQGVLLIMAREGEYFGQLQKVVLEGDEWNHYVGEWINAVERFYEMVEN